MKFPILLLFATLSCCLSARLDQDWWKHGEIYDTYIWSFKDSDQDGFGDLQGLTAKLDHIKDLGVTIVKLSPIFSSVQEINVNYAIDDFRKIHLTLGTMEDFDNLMRTAKAKGIKIILDFIINHCSPFHEWFEKSRRRIDPYTDYFVWKNKTATNRYAGWKWDTIRKQLYYHVYESPSADLNLRNEAVKEEIKKLIKFWLDKGVSGLNLLSAHTYLERFPSDNEDDMKPLITEDLPESYELVHELREYVDLYNKEHGGYERILIVEERVIEQFPNLHGNATYPIAHIVSQHALGDVSEGIKSLDSLFFNDTVNYWKAKNENGPTLLISEDIGSYRLANRFSNQQLIDVWLTTAYMLPNVMHIYYGQEIALGEFWTDNWELLAQRPFVSAMQWDNSLLAGFSDSEFTLLPPNTDCWEKNVEELKNTKYSTFTLIQDLLKLRKTEIVRKGDVKSYIISKWIFAFSRSYKGEGTYYIVLNLENVSSYFSLIDLDEHLPEKVKVVASSANSNYRNGNTLETKSPIHLRPSSSIVITV